MFGVDLKGVLNWGIFGVELKGFGVELKGLWNWRVLVWNWGVFGVELKGVWNWGVYGTEGGGTEGFLVWNWGILGAEKVWSLFETDVLNWGGLCGTESFSSIFRK